MHQDLAGVARALRDQGGDGDAIARELLARTSLPTEAIKALSDAADMGLAEAKPIVHRNLSPAARAAAETLWDELEKGRRELANSTDADRPAAGD